MSNLHRRCAKCGQKRADDMTVSYHRFPIPGFNNVTKARAWATYCWPSKDWSSIESLQSLWRANKVLCGRHFNSSQFYDSQRQKLSKFAVPDSPAVEQLLSNRENVLIENFNQSSETDQSSATVTSSVQIPGTSKSNANENVLSVVPSTSKSTDFPTLSMPTDLKSNINKYTPKKSGILNLLKITKVSDLTGREAKLYNLCRKKMREIIRLRKNLKKKKNIVKILSDDENIEKLSNFKISSSFALLLQSELKNAPKKPKARRYSINEKIMALALYKKSPACYRLLRRMFTLPCQSSLNKLLNKVPLNPGVNGHVFSSLKKISEEQCNTDNICILLFDEMALRKHVYYNKKTDQIEGFEDHGNHGRTEKISNKALVFMLAGLRKNWKQPIAYYLSYTLCADRMTVILKEILAECFKANLNVVATVCDLSTTNLKVLRTLGATTTEPYFMHNDREIVTILDPPHLLKCTRNLFMKHDVECISIFSSNENPVKGTAKWSHIKTFYDLEKNNSNFVFAPALTDSHLCPNTKQQMRVKLAAQVFSHSVTAGLLAKMASSELPSEAHATATFLQKFDQLFDALNADSPDLRGGKKFSTNISSRSPHFGLFEEMRSFLSTMRYLGSKNKPPSQEGWLQTINAVERLWKNLQFYNIRSLATRRLNQDPLENCFGCIRYNCGSNCNPTIPQFVGGLKTAIITNLRNSGQKRNCEEDNGILVNNLKSFLSAEIKKSENKDVSNVELDEDEIDVALADAIEAVEQATPEGQACAYVCGFIFKKLRQNECLNCRKLFLSKNQEPIHTFTILREYDNQKRLNYMSREVILCIEIMATIIQRYLQNEAWKPHLKQNILKLLSNVDFIFLKYCEIHEKRNELRLKESVFFICVKRFIILKNREVEDIEKKKALERKMKILKNK